MKRFGRNQKRKLKHELKQKDAEIKRLNSMLEGANVIFKEYESTFDVIRDELGSNSGLIPPSKYFADRIPYEYAITTPIQSSAFDPNQPFDLYYYKELMYNIQTYVIDHPRRFDGMVHFEFDLGVGGSRNARYGYCISERMLYNMNYNAVYKTISTQITKQILNQIGRTK